MCRTWNGPYAADEDLLYLLTFLSVCQLINGDDPHIQIAHLKIEASFEFFCKNISSSDPAFVVSIRKPYVT